MDSIIKYTNIQINKFTMKKILKIFFNAESLFGRCLLAFAYIFVYDIVYENFVYHFFNYMGLDYIEMSLPYRVHWMIFSILPFVAYQGINNLSSFLSLFLYLFVYIPFIHALYITWGISYFTTLAYSSILCVFFILYFRVGKEITIFKKIIIKPSLPFKIIEIIALLLTLIFVLYRGGSMHFVNIFTQVDVLYDLRAKNAEAADSIGIIPYLQGWLFGAFYPFLLVNYLHSKKRLKAICIICGYFALFMVDMQKITFFMPFVLIVFYRLVKLNEKTISQNLHSIIMSIIIIFSIVLLIFSNNTIVFSIGLIFLLRTVCVGGWLGQLYLHFFRENAFLHYSHINIVNAITGEYPYDVPLGVAVSYGSQNANANFFLTDGLAAWGLFGVFIIAVIFYILMHLIISISYRYKKADLIIIFLPTLSYLLNTSLFTTLLSNGLLILILILMSAKCPISDNILKEEEYEK